jgi:hypothetical protein
MSIDAFIKDVTVAKMKEVYLQYKNKFAAIPVRIRNNSGDVVGFHILIKFNFYKQLEAAYPAKVMLWQEVSDLFKRLDKYPTHIYGVGGWITTCLDVDDQYSAVTFGVNSDYGYSIDGEHRYIIEDGQLVEDDTYNPEAVE